MRRLIPLLVLSVLMTGCVPRPAKPAIAPGTEPETACMADADCRCRIFDGAAFLPGDTDGHCCDARDVANGSCRRANICMECTYE